VVGAAVLLLEAPHVARHGYGRAAVPGRSVTAGGEWWVVDDSQITTGEGLRWLVSGGSRAVQCATQRGHQPTSASIGLPQSGWLPVSSTSSSPCVEAMCVCGRVREGGGGYAGDAGDAGDGRPSVVFTTKGRSWRPSRLLYPFPLSSRAVPSSASWPHELPGPITAGRDRQGRALGQGGWPDALGAPPYSTTCSTMRTQR
jgi:hypothetical protein